MSRQNIHNGYARGHLHREIGRALERYQGGSFAGATSILDGVWAQLSQRGMTHPTSWNGGAQWTAVVDQYHSVRNQVLAPRPPCECWYCYLPEKDREAVDRNTAEKLSHLREKYKGDTDSLHIGALAEALFAFYFGLELNLIKGFDGGIDFEVPSTSVPSGRLSIDVKASRILRSNHPRLGPFICPRFPIRERWKNDANHVYVLFSVLDGKHTDFVGFAFGSDASSSIPSRSGSESYSLFLPRPKRNLEEFLALMGLDPAACFRS